MVNAQEWLDKKFSDRENIKEIKLDKDEEISGELVIDNFFNLEKIWLVSLNNEEKLTKLKIINCPNLNSLNCWHNELVELKITNSESLGFIYCQDNKLTELDLSNCSKVHTLNCSKNELVNLRINNCSFLKNLDCSENNLKDLNINNLYNLEEVNCSDNELTDVNFSVFGKNLTDLDLSNNNFAPRDLICFCNLANLTHLYLGTNSRGRINKEIYNRFYGSLWPLQDSRKLYALSIEATDIEEGLGYLNLASLGSFRCFYWNRPTAKVKKIYDLIKAVYIEEHGEENITEEENSEYGPECDGWGSLWVDKAINYQANNFASFRKLQEKTNDIDYLQKKVFTNQLVSTKRWLDQNYPKEKRRWVREIFINKQVEGRLDLSDFYVSLNKVYISHTVDASKILIKNKREDVEVIKLIDAQKYINQKYSTQEERKKIVELEINDKLEGSLDLSDFVNLQVLNCDDNKLTSLNLSKCSQLEETYCRGNQLIDLDSLLNSFQPHQLKRIDLGSNSFSVSNLTPFSKFINLEVLYVFDNLFTGTLEPLKNLTNLRELNISNTNIDRGLEYLPESLNYFSYFSKHKESKLKKIKKQLAPYEDYEGDVSSIKKWRKSRGGLVKKTWQEKETSSNSENLLLISKKIEEVMLTSEKPFLERFIARGGYGEVYYGKWKLQDVAVKKLFLSPNNISQKDLKDIRKEINILKNLQNKHVIQYYGTYSDSKEILIIMDYAENGTLTESIKARQDQFQDWNLNTKFIKQLALGLAYIHLEGIIHRDLKSMNILLTEDHNIKISDFGLSKTKNVSASYTKDNAKGTLRWMAPELLKDIENPKYSEQSDIYAFGMITWEIAAKCTEPFKDIEYNLIALYITGGGKETIPNDIPRNIQHVIQQCWQDNPSERTTLEKILEMIGSDNIQESYNSSSLEKQSRSQDNEKINSNSHTKQFDEFVLPTSAENLWEQNWTNINPLFIPELINQWISLNFTYQQTRDWINIGLTPTDFNFATWLRDIIQTTPEQVLNENSDTELRELFQKYTNNQYFQTNIEISPKRN